MRGSAILRELRQLTMLPLRRETIYHLVFNPQGTEQPALNRLIAVDPALALALLRLVPRSFREGRIGIAQLARFAPPDVLYELVRQTSKASGGASQACHVVSDQLWNHSIAVAHAARHQSRSHSYPHAQTAFLAGLVHNLGLLAAATIAPDRITKLFERANATGDWPAAEEECLGTSHTNLANQLAKRWGLPQWLHEVVWWHHQADRSLPTTLADRSLVQLVREADAIVSRAGFGLGRPVDAKSWELPWKSGNSLVSAVSRGVRQAATFFHDHPLKDSVEHSDKLVARAVELATQNTALHSELDWRKVAWEKFAAVPPDATPVELTAIVAETFAHALGVIGSACYVRTDDGCAAEGAFWCDGTRPANCILQQGQSAKPHAEQFVAHLRQTWQQRRYKQIDLQSGEETLAHVLVWLDDFGPAPRQEAIEQAAKLCTCWLARATHIAQLETQLESLTTSLRTQAAGAAAALEEAKLAALAELAAGAGHEINNPLAVISGRAQLLIAEETDPRRRKSLETIVAQAQRIHRMIVDLMTFARPPAADCKPLRIAEAIERAASAVKQQAESQQVSLTVSAPADLPDVNGDVAQLAAAVECILTNSLQATPEGGAVQVIAEVGPDSTVQVKVSDTGHGISEEQRQHIFEPFYSGRDAGRGLGMGLPKAWRLIQNHHGEIVVESGPHGTSVTVRLPALTADTNQKRACA